MMTPSTCSFSTLGKTCFYIYFGSMEQGALTSCNLNIPQAFEVQLAISAMYMCLVLDIHFNNSTLQTNGNLDAIEFGMAQDLR